MSEEQQEALEGESVDDNEIFGKNEKVGLPVAGILQVFGKLHRGHVLHRDLTPMNVFVCQGRRLKLGDFGLVRHQSDRRGATVGALYPMMAPSDIALGAVPKWQARDDVYQVGQLLGMLVRGDARSRIRLAEIRRLPCSDQLKEIVYRCIGERRKRYETADELIEALRSPTPTLKVGRLRTLRGVHLAFTGILGRPRREARAAARRAGPVVHGGPSARTTVDDRGQPNPRQADPTVSVTGYRAGVDSPWEQSKPKARKMLVNHARREATVPSVQRILSWHSCRALC